MYFISYEANGDAQRGGSSTPARDPPRSTRFICSKVRRLPEEIIRETRDRLPGINGVCARREPELETADVLQLLLGITPEKQVVCLLVLVDLDRPFGFPVQMHPRRPRVVAVRAHVIAVEQRVIRHLSKMDPCSYSNLGD